MLFWLERFYLICFALTIINCQPNNIQGTIECGNLMTFMGRRSYIVNITSLTIVTYKTCTSVINQDTRLHHWFYENAQWKSDWCQNGGGYSMGLCQWCGPSNGEQWDLTLSSGTYYIEAEPWASGEIRLSMDCTQTSVSPTTYLPTSSPTSALPTNMPTVSPTLNPTTDIPTTNTPTTKTPTINIPTKTPTYYPSSSPTRVMDDGQVIGTDVQHQNVTDLLIEDKGYTGNNLWMLYVGLGCLVCIVILGSALYLRKKKNVSGMIDENDTTLKDLNIKTNATNVQNISKCGGIIEMEKVKSNDVDDDEELYSQNIQQTKGLSETNNDESHDDGEQLYVDIVTEGYGNSDNMNENKKDDTKTKGYTMKQIDDIHDGDDTDELYVNAVTITTDEITTNGDI